MKTSDLIGPALDWAVCEAAGLFAAYPKVKKNFVSMWQRGSTYFIHPSSDWAQGGPIIEREKIDLNWLQEMGTVGTLWEGRCGGALEGGSTPLIAAMRAFVASNLGENVDVPEGLTS
jgi:hypothetical protein